MAGAGDKTEKATPKRRAEARKEGQVARSMEINSAFAMLAGFGMLVIWGPRVWQELSSQMVISLTESGGGTLARQDVMNIFMHVCKVMLVTAGPFFAVLALVGVIANVMQVKLKFTPEAIKPRLSKLNPISGFKQKFGVQSLFELAKSLVKMGVVGIPAAMVVYKRRNELLTLGDAEPIVAAQVAGSLIKEVGFKVAGIYVVVAILDYIWQKHRFEKQLKMSKSDVKQEARQQDIAPELKAAQRRRQRDQARRRMLAEVPNADVIITNPTHFAVALKYDPDIGAPQVVAKGADLLAKRIREIADEHGVLRVENKPLARQLYASVEVGQLIPAELFTAVAEILAFVYRTNNRQSAAVGSGRQRALEHA